jgi:acetylglutamate kinase
MSKIVIKLGGSSLQNPGTLQQLALAVRGYKEKNHQVVVVHGGGPAINQELTKRGIEWQFINGQRKTTPEMMSVIEEVLAKQINGQLVDSLRAAGIPSIGMSGTQGKMLFCSQANAELMQVGKVDFVNTRMIDDILGSAEADFLAPVVVIAPIGIGLENEKYNINADWAAAKIAIALKAESLIFLTDQNGILDQEKQLVHEATPKLIHQMIDDGVILGGMYTKVMTMMAALHEGVRQVQVLNASVASSLTKEKCVGTRLSEEGPLALLNPTKDRSLWN